MVNFVQPLQVVKVSSHSWVIMAYIKATSNDFDVFTMTKSVNRSKSTGKQVIYACLHDVYQTTMIVQLLDVSSAEAQLHWNQT
jgi:hypothetical protein